MTKKLTMAGIALVAAFALAVVAVGHAGDAVACDKAKTAKAEKAEAKTCSKAATAKTASASGCSQSAAAKTASASGCSKSAAAKTASASGCSQSTAAKTASAGCCAGAAAKTASAGDCQKGTAAKTASAGDCQKSTAAKTASAGCCEGMNAVAGYSKAGNNCDTKECPASECADKYAESLKKVVDEIPQGERARVILSGTIECAHCTYQAVDTCQPLLKTADGKVYPMLHNNLIKRMKHSGAATVEVTSNVRNAHGVKYLDVKTFKAL